MRLYLIFITLSLTILQGCGFLAKKGYGAKKPKIESSESITTWLKENNLGSENVATVSGTDFYRFFPVFSQSPLLFEKNGRFLAVGFSNGKFCPQDVDIYLSRIKPYDQLIKIPDSFIVSETIIIPPDSSDTQKKLSRNEINDLVKNAEKKKDTIRLDFYSIMQSLYTLNGEQIKNTFQISRYDYLLILPFAKYFGNHLQVKDLKKYSLAAKRNESSKIQILFLNLDKQNWWGKELNEKVKISI
jgi:hypothetical protein